MNGTRPKPRPGARTAPAALGLRRQNTGSASGGNINGLGSKQSHIKVTVRIRPLYLRPSSFVNDGDAPDSHFSSTTTLTSTQDSIPLSLSSHDLLLQQHHAHHRRTVSPIDEQLLVFDPIGPTTQGGTPADGEIPGTPARGRTIALGRRHKNMCYGFDRIFSEDSTQQEVYEETTKPLIEGVLDGYNSTVFAYGATGCGKTYTITGTADQPGVIYRTMEDLFARMRELESERVIEAELSYLEVYNEQIRDLLKDQAPLDLREDDKGVQVMKLSKHVLLDVEDVMELLIRGNENRSKAPTAANETSSRSHAVLQIHVKQRDRASGTHTTWKTAILSIIDLAGSERASATKNRGDRLREGAKINRSLLALGNCINALCKSVNSRHIPYRDSKLTRLLKFSLGGNCKVVMVANISPHPSYYEETHNTLMYANRAKEIKTKVEQNRVNVEAGVEEYKNIIAELEDQVKQLREQLLEARSSGVKGDPSGGRAPFEQVTGSRGLRFLRNQLLPLVLQQELARESALAELEIIKQHSDVCSSVKENVWGSEYDVDLTQLKSFVNRIETECFQRLQQHHSRLRDCEGRLDDLERLVQKVAQKTREMLASRDLEAGEDSWTVNVLDELIAVERYRILKEVATARDRATRILDGHTRNRTDRLLHSFTKILASSATIQSGASSPSRDPSRIRDRVSAVFEDGVVFLQDLLSSLDDRPAGLEQGTWIDEATMDRLLSETDQVISELKEEAAAPVMDPKLFATALRGKSTAAEIRAKRSTAAGSSGPSQAVRTARSQLIFGSSSTETGMAANKPNERPVLKSTVSAINLGASTAARRAISDHQAGPIRISSPQRRKDRKVTPISRATSAEEPLFNPPLPDPKRALAAVASAVRSCRDQWDRPWRQNAQLPKAEPPSLSTSSLASASMPNLAASASTRKVISPNQSGRLSGNPSEGLSDRVLSVDTGLAVEADGRRGRSSKSSSPSIGGGGQAAGGPGLKKIWK